MKYSQFLELREILESQNISIQEFSKNPDTLNEGGLMTWLGAQFGKMTKFLGKKIGEALSTQIGKTVEVQFDKKIKEIQAKLNVELKKIKAHKEADQTTASSSEKPKSKSTNDIGDAIGNMYTTKRKAISSLSDNDKRKKDAIEQEIDEQITKYLEDVLEIESQRVDKKIREKQTIGEKERSNLQLAWKLKMIQLKLWLMAKLAEMEIIALRTYNKAAKYDYDMLTRTDLSKQIQNSETSAKDTNKDQSANTTTEDKNQ